MPDADVVVAGETFAQAVMGALFAWAAGLVLVVALLLVA